MKIYEKQNFNIKGTKESTVIELVKILEDFAQRMENSGFKKVFRPSIKCANIMENCAPVNSNDFIDKCIKKDNITGNNDNNDYNDWCKINIIFDDGNYIYIKYIKEYDNELFDECLENIKDCLSIFETKIIKYDRKKPIDYKEKYTKEELDYLVKYEMSNEELEIFNKMIENVKKRLKDIEMDNYVEIINRGLSKSIVNNDGFMLNKRGYSKKYGYFEIEADWRNYIITFKTLSEEEAINIYVSNITKAIKSNK